MNRIHLIEGRFATRPLICRRGLLPTAGEQPAEDEGASNR